MKITWVDWLRMGLFLFISNYINMLAAMIIMCVGEFSLWIIGGLFITLFASEKPATENSLGTNRQTL